jgi:hypothetical protein
LPPASGFPGRPVADWLLARGPPAVWERWTVAVDAFAAAEPYVSSTSARRAQGDTRRIHVDIRYALWVMNAVEGAERIMKEMGAEPAIP